MHDHTGKFEEQVAQIAGLGVWHIVTGKPMKLRLEPIADHRWEEKTGVFVTLKNKGQIRGSVGMIETSTTLQETLFDAGISAATHDQRFVPVEEWEIPELEIEVTLLNEVRKMDSPEQIVIGEMGLMISRGEKHAILLPQVAADNKWSPEQFLEALCEKAQLSHKAWKDPNTLVEYFVSHTIRGGSLFEKIKEFV
jgi:uncharacterized protein